MLSLLVNRDCLNRVNVLMPNLQVEQILKTQVIHKLKHDYAPGTATQKTMDMLQSKVRRFIACS